MNELECLRTFLKVIEVGSFAEAARQMDTSKSVVAKRINQLEASLELELLQRSTRRLSITDTGTALYERTLPILAELDEAKAEVSSVEWGLSGTFRISCISSFTARYLARDLCEFQSQHENLRIEMQQHDRFCDPVQEGFDICLQPEAQHGGHIEVVEVLPLRRMAVVTGAAQGLGRTYAVALAEHGAKVVVTDVQDTTETVEAITSAGGQALGLNVDVTSDESLAEMVVSAESEFGPIEILINNAAIFAAIELKPFTQLSNDEWDLVMRVNARGPFQATKAVMPSMQKNGRGKIINISSGTFLRGAPMFVHYVSSKGAVIAQTRALSRELATDNICINTMVVGFTESEGVKDHAQLGGARAPTLAMRAISREMLPEDLVGTMMYLASEDSDFITGQSINIDGGALNQ